jgi:hypothetical protein
LSQRIQFFCFLITSRSYNVVFLKQYRFYNRSSSMSNEIYTIKKMSENVFHIFILLISFCNTKNEMLHRKPFFVPSAVKRKRMARLSFLSVRVVGPLQHLKYGILFLVTGSTHVAHSPLHMTTLQSGKLCRPSRRPTWVWLLQARLKPVSTNCCRGK